MSLKLVIFLVGLLAGIKHFNYGITLINYFTVH